MARDRHDTTGRFLPTNGVLSPAATQPLFRAQRCSSSDHPSEFETALVKEIGHLAVQLADFRKYVSQKLSVIERHRKYAAERPIARSELLLSRIIVLKAEKQAQAIYIKKIEKLYNLDSADEPRRCRARRKTTT